MQVGYSARGNIRKGTSAGTRASVAGVLLEAGYAFRGGRIVDERSAADVISFDIDGTTREAFRLAHRSTSRCPGSGRGPGGQTASPRRRRKLATVHLTGGDPYSFTAPMLAWAAGKAAAEGVRPAGALGPVEAFGADALQSACASAGFLREPAQPGQR